MVKTKPTGKLLQWKKSAKTAGGLEAAHAGAAFKLVPKPECVDWYWLLLDGEKRAEGTKQFCKAVANRAAAQAGKKNPAGVTVGATRKKLEDPEDFFIRMAAEFGYRPYFLAGCSYVLKEAKIDPDVLTPEFLRRATEKSWPLYRDKLEQDAERAHLAGDLRKILGLPPGAPLAARNRAFQEDVERERKAWFRGPAAKDEDLAALARRGAAGPPPREEKEAPAPAAQKVRGKGVVRDEWGYPVASKAGRINAALTFEPKTAKRVAKDAGVDNAASHLAALVNKKLAKKLPDGTYRRRKIKNS